MSFEVLSTISWNVLGTFEDENETREAVSESLTQGGAEAQHLLLTVLNDDAEVVQELTGQDLASWAGIHAHA